uniref:Uncharacterized protein n=1 Tax=Parascaris univalens TaxID=6257 RepID=A0A914ZGA0_PARUN
STLYSSITSAPIEGKASKRITKDKTYSYTIMKILLTKPVSPQNNSIQPQTRDGQPPETTNLTIQSSLNRVKKIRRKETAVSWLPEFRFITGNFLVHNVSTGIFNNSDQGVRQSHEKSDN